MQTSEEKIKVRPLHLSSSSSSIQLLAGLFVEDEKPIYDSEKLHILALRYHDPLAACRG